MDYEITGTTTQPDERGRYRVDYRTADGRESWVKYSPSCGPPEAVVERDIERVAEEAAAANRPPGNFGMFVKMDGSDATYEELKQIYRDFARARGYEVNEKMVPYKPAVAVGACPPAPPASAHAEEAHEAPAGFGLPKRRKETPLKESTVA